ncbi:DUF3179 domain-containing (seleno)protein [Halobaculum sp. MBLA0147]|uniref:DUF3179 domain-containing (seleno)protein n=1 Tax=Halobaculum sp. MBLA0147 TaxID=3079934 RepID=UPI003525B00A
MNRRDALAGLAVGVGSLAGCLDVFGRGGRSGRATQTERGSRTGRTESDESGERDEQRRDAYDGSLAAQGVPTTICSEAVVADPGKEALVDPQFAPDWTSHRISDRYEPATGSSGGIDPRQTVVVVETGDGRARAYPLEVLAEHEIVNDTFGGPLLVTFCPICRSGVVADRRVPASSDATGGRSGGGTESGGGGGDTENGGDTESGGDTENATAAEHAVAGETLTFAVSGLLWQPERIQVAAAEQGNRTFGAERTGGESVGVRAGGNLVLYDTATGSYWSQILARAICGPATGTTLPVRPSRVTTWETFRAERPDGEVLLPPPHSGVHDRGAYVGRTPGPPPERSTSDEQ